MANEANPFEFNAITRQALDQAHHAVDAYFDILKEFVSEFPSGGTVIVKVLALGCLGMQVAGAFLLGLEFNGSVNGDELSGSVTLGALCRTLALSSPRLTASRSRPPSCDLPPHDQVHP